MPRAILIVLDGVGCGALPDADLYGDEGSNSLANTAAALGGLSLANMGRMGLGNIVPIEGVPRVDRPTGCFGKMAERSTGKDSAIGHWEMMGVIVAEPFPLFPNGFDAELIDKFEKAVGRKVIGNEPASGTEIIERLGPRQLETGELIVYTSADSVFQVAAHKSVVPLEELYEICETARAMLSGPYRVNRVIARPYEGEPGAFARTPERKDYAVEPPGPTLLDKILDAGMQARGVGKIEDLFGGRGFSGRRRVSSNAEAIEAIAEEMRSRFDGLLFANLIDFDTKYGHRNDIEGYARALMEFDEAIPAYIELLREDELLFITSDHGNDPTTPSTDHAREYAPLLVKGPGAGKDLGVRATFADVGETIARLLGLPPLGAGRDFLEELT
jgi:phosphopentomutase